MEEERIGRAGARAVRAERPILFRAYEEYLDIRSSHGNQYDWDDLAQTVATEFAADDGDRRYRHVVVDEGQDFSPAMLRSLVAAIPEDGSLTFFGDMAQQIYGNRLSWRAAGCRSRRYGNSPRITATRNRSLVWRWPSQRPSTSGEPVKI